ncbi:hypothetical protein [Clostridium chromiireducens]|uniref:hypothetical protein n=1 Tax=Clostridium chromiireducens TaxID=225345 RepID=UPI001FA9C546|nr:hypothetical protein [Clostridium chromiireducens]
METILEGTEKSRKTIKLTKGKYRFRNFGANADGKIRISVSSNSDVKITKDKKQ